MNEHWHIRSSCPVCSDTAFTRLLSIEYNSNIMLAWLSNVYQNRIPVKILANAKYELLRCNTCTLIYQTHVLSESSLTQMYDKWIDPDLSQIWYFSNTKRTRRSYESRLSFIQLQLKKNDITCLDYGAGLGFFANMAQKNGFNVTAYDPSKQRQKFMSAKNIPVMSSLNSEQTFDFINIDQVLEHVSNPVETLDNARKRLSSRGIIYLGIPYSARLRKNILKIDLNRAEHTATKLQAASPFQHVNCFNFRSVRKLADICGLEIIFSPIKEACSFQLTSLPELMRDFIRPFYHYYTTSVFASIAASEARRSTQFS